MRAERRLGELIRAQKETVGLATGGDAIRTRFQPGTEVRPTLADAGQLIFPDFIEQNRLHCCSGLENTRMDLKSLWKIDRWYVAQIEAARKKCRANPLSFIEPGIMAPDNSNWENALNERDRIIEAHRDWVKGVFA